MHTMKTKKKNINTLHNSMLTPYNIKIRSSYSFLSSTLQSLLNTVPFSESFSVKQLLFHLGLHCARHPQKYPTVWWGRCGNILFGVQGSLQSLHRFSMKMRAHAQNSRLDLSVAVQLVLVGYLVGWTPSIVQSVEMSVQTDFTLG